MYSSAALAQRFMALFAVLAMGLGAMASPAEAAPFAYVVNGGDGTVSVIDTATPPVRGGHGPGGEWRRGGRCHPGREARLCCE
jgi:hypothetical protein